MGSRIGERVGAFELLRSLGQGGFGEVFEARNETTHQKVAIKLLLPDVQQSQENDRRFLREARVLAGLEHPGIVKVRHCERLADETIYIAMEYLEGQTLHAWMQDHRGRVTLAAALAIGVQIAAAMTLVHAKGIIHRDLKPGNIFLIPKEDGPQVKILDFGIAKAPLTNEIHPETDLATSPTQVFGSEGYMSPEHYQGAEHVGMPSDVYALGLILFELITGRSPFSAETSYELMIEQRNGTQPSLHDLVPTVPAALSTFLSSMLALEPELRPSMLRVHEKLAGPWESGTTGCLLPGLEPFSGKQAELFFGRQTEAQEILARLDRARTGKQRWIQIEGPSGVGKTSLVQAGVLTKLEEQRSPNGSPLWRVARLRPSDDPIRSLAQALFTAYQGSEREPTREVIERSLRDDGEDALAKLAKAHTPPSDFLLLVIEQMEDLLSFAGVAPSFDALVAPALIAPDSPVRLLSTLRSEFLHRLDQSPKLAALLDEDARYRVLPMEQQKLKQVVERMAERVGMKLAEGLAEQMSRDAAGADSRLPLLGYTLRELWTPENELITLERYISSGGVSGTLTRHAQRLLGDLGEEERARAKWLILHLVQVGRGVPDTRRSRTLREMLNAAEDDPITEKVLAHLEGKSLLSSSSTAHNLRLLVRSTDPAPSADAQRFDLVHETLLRDERTILRWIEEERPRLERHEGLEIAAQEWESTGSQKTESLPSGSLLDHYRFFDVKDKLERDRSGRMISSRAQNFLQAAKRLSLRRQRIKWALWAALALGVASILFFAIVARREQKRAEETLSDFIITADKIVSDTDWLLARMPNTLGLRKQVLHELEQRLADLPLRDRSKVEVRVVSIRIKQRSSDLARDDGSLSEARQLLEDSKKDIDAGLGSYPSNKDFQKLFGLYYSKLGKIELAQGKIDNARTDFAAARAFSTSVSVSDKSADSIRIHATNVSEQADVEMADHVPIKALPMYEDASSLLDGLVHSESNDSAYNWSLLSDMLCASAMASRKIDDPQHLKIAHERIERAAGVQETILRKELGNAYYASTMARIYLERAELLYQEGQLEGAAHDYEKALRLGRELHEVDPTRKPYGLVLGASLRGQEKLSLRRGDPGGAKEVERERQDLAREFLSKDREDVRFQRLLEEER